MCTTTGSLHQHHQCRLKLNTEPWQIPQQWKLNLTSAHFKLNDTWAYKPTGLNMFGERPGLSHVECRNEEKTYIRKCGADKRSIIPNNFFFAQALVNIPSEYVVLCSPFFVRKRRLFEITENIYRKRQQQEKYIWRWQTGSAYFCQRKKGVLIFSP